MLDGKADIIPISSSLLQSKKPDCSVTEMSSGSSSV